MRVSIFLLAHGPRPHRRALHRGRAGAAAYLVGLYITAAYWFTASTSFANPAVTIARAMTDNLAASRCTQCLVFSQRKSIAAIAAYFFFGWLFREHG